MERRYLYKVAIDSDILLYNTFRFSACVLLSGWLGLLIQRIRRCYDTQSGNEHYLLTDRAGVKARFEKYGAFGVSTVNCKIQAHTKHANSRLTSSHTAYFIAIYGRLYFSLYLGLENF